MTKLTDVKKRDLAGGRNVFFERKVRVESDTKVVSRSGWGQRDPVKVDSRCGNFRSLLWGANKEVFTF